VNLEQIELVKKTWSQVSGDPDAVAALFYDRLFQIAPEARPLFPESMEEQGAKLMQMLATAIANLDRLGEVRPALTALAVRHLDYGTLPEHYPIVGQALLDTLDRGLGEDFTPEVRAAWSEIYEKLSSIMIVAAAET